MQTKSLSFPNVSICNISCFDWYEIANISVSPSFFFLILQLQSDRDYSLCY